MRAPLVATAIEARRRPLQERLSQRDRVQSVATVRPQQRHQRDRRLRCVAAGAVAGRKRRRSRSV